MWLGIVQFGITQARRSPPNRNNAYSNSRCHAVYLMQPLRRMMAF